ncbi:MAG TPA: YbaB/EbfC family nucleoid-associated protein [Spirochaetota bacterium]|nr:YbaB/EbfC family nucleoid-associated protein [Spirochaetota bacterium]HPI88562.1 YbaB/EbfC family nucleoid-associated protein [Spirochaetota bacterium]HPR48203.1 YbaB/EbfC family nucleoid-associated protein [Spirochaetota bacterium]
MLKGLGDIGNLMKLQKEFKNTQKKITKARITGESPGGEVKATFSGDYKLVELNIDVKDPDVKKIEKAVAAAVNDAVDKVKEFSAEEMGKLTGGLNLPGLGSFLK